MFSAQPFSILSFHVYVVCTCGVASKADAADKFRDANEPTAEIDFWGEEGVLLHFLWNNGGVD
jgi:hypothetical protein